MKTPAKILLSLTAAFIFLIVIVAAYQYGLTRSLPSQVNNPSVIPSITPQLTNTPSTADTKATVGWTTFENKDLGISFKYPNNWISEGYPDSRNVSWYLPSVPERIKETERVMDISYENPEGATLEEHAAAGMIPFDIVKELTINQVRFVISTDSTTDPDRAYKATALYKNQIIDLVVYGTRTKTINAKPEDILDQILSTFKFSKPTDLGWKTYSNNQYGFSFKYPSSFTPNIKKDSNFAAEAEFNSLDYQTQDTEENTIVSDGYSLAIRYDITKTCSQSNDPSLHEKVNTRVGGYPAVKYYVAWEGMVFHESNISLSNSCLTVNLGFGGKYSKAQAKTLFDQILSTFKFSI